MNDDPKIDVHTQRDDDDAPADDPITTAKRGRRSESFSEVRLPVLLLIATLITTIWAGWYWAEAFYLNMDPSTATLVVGALSFSLPLLAILVTHEMGHYLMARRLGVPVSLPFFIPLPPVFPLGTMGAIIRMRGIPPDRSTLLKIGAAGPIAGGIVALPVMALGILNSRPTVLTNETLAEGTIRFGDSLTTLAMQAVLHPDLAPNETLFVSPLFMAGWAGFLITMLNLMPLGQLDGGHVGYGLIGSRLSRFWWVVAGALAVMGVFGWVGWFLWVGIALLFGRRHFAVPDPARPLDRSARVMAAACLFLFVITFMPAPIHMNVKSVGDMVRDEIERVRGGESPSDANDETRPDE